MIPGHDPNCTKCCDNFDCPDCYPESWRDQMPHDAEPAWPWYVSATLLALIVVLALVLAAGTRP